MTSPLPDGPLDSLGVLETILATPEAVADAGRAEIETPPPVPAGVVLVAAGADALVAQAAQALVGPWSPVPVVVHTGHGIPAFVSDAWRCLFISRADDPAEAPEVFDALAAAARHRAVLHAVGSGPLLESVAERDGTVVRMLDRPPAPRFGFAATLVTTLVLLDRLGAICTRLGGGGPSGAASAAAAQLSRRRAELHDGGDAARLARRIGRTLPLVYGAGPIGEVAARRWKSQVNANVKAAAFAAALPGLVHDDLSGWGQHGDMTRQVFTLITLRHDHEHDVDRARFPWVVDLVDEVVHDHHEVVAEGAGPLAQLLDLVFVGDLVSYHLAQVNEIDPGPTTVAGRVES